MELCDSSSMFTPSNIKGIFHKSISEEIVGDFALQTLPNELKKIERYRLETFKVWPSQSIMDPKKLAKAGFYSTGVQDEVKCFSCGGTLKDWKFGDVAIVKHRNNFPNCDFVNNKCQDNHPMYPNENVIDRITTSSGSSRNCESINSSSIEVNGDSSVSSRDSTDGGPREKHNPPQSSYNNFEVDPKYRYEAERLNSFRNSWPLSFIRPEELAKVGFFYIFSQDKVQCAFCYGIVGHWEQGDDPLTEHAKHFPTCPFLLNFEVGNIPLGTNNSNFNIEVKGKDVVGRSNSIEIITPRRQSFDSSSQSSYENLGIISAKPRHSSQAVIDARLRSFSNPDYRWPADSTISAEALAQAGFFYTGVEDSTRCFHCNGGLKNWVKGDDPWKEHARWYPKCNFVKLNKGEKFIEDCQVKSKEESKPIASQEANYSSIQSKIESVMKSLVVSQVLEMGVSEDYVRNALWRQFQSTGAGFSSVSELFDAVQSLRNEVLYQPEAAEPFSISETSGGMKEDMKKSQSEAAPKQEVQAMKESLNFMTLEEENRALKEQKMCKICMDQEIGVVFLPCGHFLSCPQCAPALTECPLCRKPVRGSVRTFLS